ncbi:hypothetical protein [Myxococcus landrumensis]|uniref:Uncharacterized protein n=1 Tax=Myxococcus landrumensis TaxID=2813577 RepID=A0ABX7N5M9_9BACT|nr:hypothetical protein [Myxococcus landrumus]QSQ14036.1 hypothetical protein JY572_37940 [Myxococcus landrumus]
MTQPAAVPVEDVEDADVPLPEGWMRCPSCQAVQPELTQTLTCTACGWEWPRAREA